MADKVTHSQTTPPPSRLVRDPNRHYVKVQMDAPKYDYTSPMYDLMDMTSPTDPNAAMYREESTSPRDTGHSQMVLLSCSKEDDQASIAAIAKDARFRENAVQSTDMESESLTRIRQSIS